MKILMLAPEPFFSPRGTPFSEYHRIKSLCRSGHQVDLVTYPIGRNVRIPGLKIYRCINPFFFKKIKTGPSFAKIVLDFFMFFLSLRLFVFKRYDLIHTHEESALLGVFLRKIRKVPHLYDMHSSLVQQMDNFQTTKSTIVLKFFNWFERIVLADASSVIVICKTLFDHASNICGPEKLVLIENFVDDLIDGTSSAPKRPEIALGEKIVFYAGTLEPYQGIPLLLAAMPALPNHVRLWIAGGRKDQIETLKKEALMLNIDVRVYFFGQLNPEQIPGLIDLADVLVSPRSKGTNIPLKVYSFLKSGKPLVATNILSHTQTLTPDISILVDPEPSQIARGIEVALSKEGDRIARAASVFCRENFSEARYDRLVLEALEKTRSKE